MSRLSYPSVADASQTGPEGPGSQEMLPAVASVQTHPLRGDCLRRRAGEGDLYASTSTGYVLGQMAEAALIEGLIGAFGVPVVAGGSSAVEALRA